MTHNQIEQQILQPIKDLTENWNIDIAAYLEDYMEELQHITISFDGGETTLNFAQSAMLVQGSACVYSKKVEYLYSLVYKVLDMLANKRKQTQKSSVDNDGNDEDADFRNTGEDEEFLTLDDIDDGRNIYMKNDFEAGESFRLLPEIPLCLIRMDEGEKGDNPLLSKSGEVLGSRDDFKINTCRVDHETGVLLLDMSHLTFLADLLTQISKSQAEVQTQPEVPAAVDDTDMGAPEMPIASNTSVDDCDMMPLANEEEDEVDGTLPGGNVSQQEVAVQEEAGLRRSEREKRPVPRHPQPVSVDPWKMIEAHEEIKPAKPFVKRGTTWKICPGLEDKQTTKKRKRKTAVDRKRTNVDSLKDFLNNVCYSTEKFPKNPHKRPLHAVAEQLFWAEFKRRQSLHKELIKQKTHDLEDIDDIRDANNEIEPLDNLPDEGPEDDDNDLVDDNLFNAIERGLEEHGTVSDGFHRSYADREPDGIITSYEELVQKYVEEYMTSAQEYAHITDLSRRVSEWEDKVLPRLQEEESHDPFDINRYGSNVIDNLDKGNTVRFHRLVQGKPVYEICRTFLACLMLANTSNVQIERKGELEEGMDKFELELLSTIRHFEELQEYQAPSLANHT